MRLAAIVNGGHGLQVIGDRHTVDRDFVLARAAIDRTHGDLRFTAPLSAITAAVVGVIVNLALFFAYHVLWPQGFAGRFDWPSALIALAAAIALLRHKLNVIPVIAGCALLGLAIH
jgi:chromate transporter